MYTVTDDISIRFWIDKCGIFAMSRGKESECEGITIESGEVIDKIDDDGYRDFGKKWYFPRKKKVSRLNNLNVLDYLSSQI